MNKHEFKKIYAEIRKNGFWADMSDHERTLIKRIVYTKNDRLENWNWFQYRHLEAPISIPAFDKFFNLHFDQDGNFRSHDQFGHKLHCQYRKHQ